MRKEALEWLQAAKIVAILPLTNEERVRRPHRKIYLMVVKGRQSRDVYLCMEGEECWVEIDT